MKNTLALLGALALAITAQAQTPATTHKLTKLWETETALKVPESVRLDAKRKLMYVSNIDGEPWAADGKGSIAKVGLDGKIIAAEWVTGLDAPKGMALSEDGKLQRIGRHRQSERPRRGLCVLSRRTGRNQRDRADGATHGQRRRIQSEGGAHSQHYWNG